MFRRSAIVLFLLLCAMIVTSCDLSDGAGRVGASGSVASEKDGVDDTNLPAFKSGTPATEADLTESQKIALRDLRVYDYRGFGLIVSHLYGAGCKYKDYEPEYHAMPDGTSYTDKSSPIYYFLNLNKERDKKLSGSCVDDNGDDGSVTLQYDISPKSTDSENDVDIESYETFTIKNYQIYGYISGEKQCSYKDGVPLNGVVKCKYRAFFLQKSNDGEDYQDTMVRGRCVSDGDMTYVGIDGIKHKISFTEEITDVVARFAKDEKFTINSKINIDGLTIDPMELTNAPSCSYPEVLSVVPAKDEKNVPVDTNVVIEFNSDILKESAEKAFRLEKECYGGGGANDSNLVAGTSAWQGSTMTFTPSSMLEPSTCYTVNMNGSAAVQNKNGEGGMLIFRSTFETAVGE